MKAALKEVSVEHNRAMAEQHRRFQQEIEQLRRALEQNQATTDTSSNGDNNANEPDIIMQADAEPTSEILEVNEQTTMESEDSSNDEASMTVAPRCITVSFKDKITSPEHKRPKRSTSRNKKGAGGPSISSGRSNV